MSISITNDSAEQTDYMKSSNIQKIAGISIPVLNIGALEIPHGKFGCSILCLGSTRSGKTTLLNYLFNKHFKDYISVLMSNSLNSDAYDFIKKQVVTSDHYHTQVLKDMYHINHESKNHYPFMVIIDDVPDKRGDPELKRLMSIYRNSRISCFVCIQGATMIDKTARGNINFILLGRMNSSEEVERNIKSYLMGHFPSTLKMADKIRLYRELTSNHQWIVLDQITNTIFLTKLTESQLIGC